MEIIGGLDVMLLLLRGQTGARHVIVTLLSLLYQIIWHTLVHFLVLASQTAGHATCKVAFLNILYLGEQQQ